MNRGASRKGEGYNASQRRSRDERHGFTLVELVMTVAVASAIAAMSAVLLHSLMRQQAATTLQMSMTESSQRLTSRFRQDARRAADAVVEEHQVQLVLPTGEQIVWTYEPGVMIRTTISNGDVRNDRFDVPLEQSLTIGRLKLWSGIELLSLKFDLPVRQGDASQDSLIKTARDLQFVANSHGMSVVAEVGRDLRLAASLPDAEVVE